ncbi:MAG: signal recognition particle-docking protein FtsY [Lachnospirales bacterium]
MDSHKPKEGVGFFAKIKKGITKTKDAIFAGVEDVLSNFTVIDEGLFEELEESLIMADMGVDTSLFIINELRKQVKKQGITEVSAIRNTLEDIIANILSKDMEPLEYKTPTVILVIGVNGAGKTTTIGKLTHKLKNEGKSVLLAAGDTFRAAAIDQLDIWAKRNEVDLIRHQENSDPAAIVFDACKAAKARNTDVLIVDTAGRLQNKKNLMEELRKIRRIIDNEHSTAKIEVFLVLDGTTGQNAVSQAKIFDEVANVTGIIITKLDGTAKGGIVVSIFNEMNIPVRYVGLGEGIDDLEEFNSKDFAKALLE